MIYLGGKARAVFYGARQVREMYAGSALVYRCSDAPLTLTAQDAGSTVALTAVGSPTVSGLMYRLGRSGEWLAYTPGTVVTLAAVGDAVQFWNTETTLTKSSSSYVRFAMTGSVAASGSVQSMVNYADCTPYCFWGLFRDCKALKTPPLMPSMKLANNCYNTTYSGSGITEFPVLPATELAATCYGSMCYYCTDITGDLILPARTLITSCYSYMCSGDNKMGNVYVAFTEWSSATSGWLSGINLAKTFYKPAALPEPETRGGSTVPANWTIINREA